jgi:tetratricopeptide (TPR) repeat protein
MLAMQISAEVAAESGNPEILRELGVHARRIADTTASSETRALAQLTRGYCFLVAKRWGKAGEAFGLCLSHIGPGLDLERRRALNALAFARHAMGDYSQAGRYYGDAARLAEQIGDAPGASSSWSNLAVIHDHRGLFTTAATVFRKALAHGIAASGPRRLVEVLLNAAGLALTAGYTEDAREMIAHAERLAIQSRHWRLLMLVKLVAADSYLALSDPEAAWQLVEETQHISRLRRHYTWHRYGLSRLQRMARESASRLHHESVEYQLEIQMFEEWVARVEGTELSPNPSALDRCKQYGSYGLLGGLLAVGIAPRGVPSRQLGEPIHTYLRCIFPEATIEHVPSREEFADYSRYDGHRGDS